MLQTNVQGMNEKQIGGPLRMPAGWFVFQIVSKVQDTPPLDKLNDMERSEIQGVATEMRREALLAALTDSLRKVVTPISVYKDRLAKVTCASRHDSGVGARTRAAVNEASALVVGRRARRGGLLFVLRATVFQPAPTSTSYASHGAWSGRDHQQPGGRGALAPSRASAPSAGA
jgi:hypothetical protein